MAARREQSSLFLLTTMRKRRLLTMRRTATMTTIREEELDNLPDHLRDIDINIEMALRICRRMMQPNGSSEYEDNEDKEEEVAESQNLFFYLKIHSLKTRNHIAITSLWITQ
jgi:hypothetical protein